MEICCTDDRQEVKQVDDWQEVHWTDDQVKVQWIGDWLEVQWIDDQQEIHCIDDQQEVHYSDDQKAAEVHWIDQNWAQTHQIFSWHTGIVDRTEMVVDYHYHYVPASYLGDHDREVKRHAVGTMLYNF